jgi:hypothetical protein
MRRLWRALFTEVGKERNPPVLQRGELGPELFQLPVDARQFGPRLPFPEVPLTLLGPHELSFRSLISGAAQTK